VVTRPKCYVRQVYGSVVCRVSRFLNSSRPVIPKFFGAHSFVIISNCDKYLFTLLNFVFYSLKFFLSLWNIRSHFFCAWIHAEVAVKPHKIEPPIIWTALFVYVCILFGHLIFNFPLPVGLYIRKYRNAYMIFDLCCTSTPSYIFMAWCLINSAQG
jgi:hypothetical protein